jgi:hypothetical protein
MSHRSNTALATNKADVGLAAIAQAQAAVGGGSNYANELNAGAILTASIPITPANGVVIAFVAVTPKFSGKFLVDLTLVTTGNANGAPQSVSMQLANSGVAPTPGTTTLPPIGALAPFVAATGGSATASYQFIVEGLTVGAQVFLSLTLSQSIAGAFSVPNEGATITATEVP